MNFKKTILGIFMTSCGALALASCSDDSNKINTIDESVLVTYTNGNSSTESYSALSSNKGIEFDKGQDYNFAVKINEDVLISSVSYDIKYDGADISVGYPVTVHHYTEIDDSVFEEWNTTYVTRNTDKGNGEHCSNLVTSYNFSLTTNVFLAPSATIKKYELDNRYSYWDQEKVLNEDTINYNNTKSASVDFEEHLACKDDWVRINISTWANCECTYDYLYCVTNELKIGNNVIPAVTETRTETSGGGSFISNNVTISNLKINYRHL